jgi:hypothetical protein
VTFPAKSDPDYDTFMAGYLRGEGERQALAIANSDLRSEVLELRRQLRACYEDVKHPF